METIQCKIIAMALSIAAEIERDLISQRTREALKFKKKSRVLSSAKFCYLNLEIFQPYACKFRS